MLSLFFSMTYLLWTMFFPMYWLYSLWGMGLVSFLTIFLMYNPFLSYLAYSSQVVTDQLAMCLVMLTVWISFLMILISMNSSQKKVMGGRLFCLIVLTLTSMLILAFTASDTLLFYFMFESSLIPTLLLILGWGTQPERVQAGLYMMLYTLFGSMPLLAGILVMSVLYSSGKMLMVHEMRLGCYRQFMFPNLIVGVFSLAFLIKLPVFPFHLWLPKAHVEASSAGSMVLAAVLLKLGGYGIMRFHSYLGYTGYLAHTLFLSMGLYGGFLMSVACFRQVDFKALVAYSSVGHMSFVLAGGMLNTVWGERGALILMIGHGLVSSALFSICGYYYEEWGSRSLMLIRGLLQVSPIMSGWLFLFCAFNMSAPTSINLLGEIMCLITSYHNSHLFIYPMSMMMFLSCVYSMYLYNCISHGQLMGHLNVGTATKAQFHLVMVLHAVPAASLIIMANTLTFL